jgi:hypothetical protein
LSETAFVPVAEPALLREILGVREERTAARQQVGFEGLKLQLPESPLRHHYVGARVRVHQYPDGALAAFHGPRAIGHYPPKGELIEGDTKKLKKAA